MLAMLAHPYRSCARHDVLRARLAVDPLRTGQVLARSFLAVWSLLRVAVCPGRGLDLEGCAALVIFLAAARSTVQDWSRFS